MQIFYNKFEELCNQVIEVSTKFLQSFFESKLRVDKRMEVRALQPTSLLQSFQLIKLMEDMIEEIKATTIKERYNYNGESWKIKLQLHNN